MPRGRRVATPVSLVDGYPTILEAVGEPPQRPRTPTCPAARSWTSPEAGDADRTVFCEYHAVGSITGIFMVRFGRYKYVHYEGYRPQLFDLEADPGETRDLAPRRGHEATIAEGDAAAAGDLRSGRGHRAGVRRPGAPDSGVRRQRGVLSCGSYPYTPAPGEAPRISP